MSTQQRRRRPFSQNVGREYRVVDPAAREKGSIQVNPPGMSEKWLDRFTALEHNRDTTCVQAFEEMVDPRERKPFERAVDWTPGSPHATISKYLAANLRGVVQKTKHLFDDEGQGYMDLDGVMAWYRPSPAFTVTLRMIGEVIKYSEKGRFAAYVVRDQEGNPRIHIKANQGHFGDVPVDITKTCELITLDNIPPACLHATFWSAWRIINCDDDSVNGIRPGGLASLAKGKGKGKSKGKGKRDEPVRREVHCASIPPGLPGTTISQLKDHDVIISVNLRAFVRDSLEHGQSAYLSPNKVVLFPEGVPRKYILDAFDRRKGKRLALTPVPQNRRPAHVSSREDALLFICARCQSPEVTQDQNPYFWPGREKCYTCTTDEAFSPLCAPSFLSERTVSMVQTEQDMREATQNDESARRRQVTLFSSQRVEAKNAFDRNQSAAKERIDGACELMRRQTEARQKLEKEALAEIDKASFEIAEKAYEKETFKILEELQAEAEHLRCEAQRAVDADILTIDEEVREGVDHSNHGFISAVTHEQRMSMIKEHPFEVQAREVEDKRTAFIRQEENYKKFIKKRHVSARAEGGLTETPQTKSESEFIERAERNPERQRAIGLREEACRQAYNSLITTYPHCRYCVTKLPRAVATECAMDQELDLSDNIVCPPCQIEDHFRTSEDRRLDPSFSSGDTMQDDSPEARGIWCGYCRMYLNGPEAYQDHLGGKKHRRNINTGAEYADPPPPRLLPPIEDVMREQEPASSSGIAPELRADQIFVSKTEEEIKEQAESFQPKSEETAVPALTDATRVAGGVVLASADDESLFHRYLIMFEAIFMETHGYDTNARIIAEELRTRKNSEHVINQLMLAICASGVLPDEEYDEELAFAGLNMKILRDAHNGNFQEGFERNLLDPEFSKKLLNEEAPGGKEFLRKILEPLENWKPENLNSSAARAWLERQHAILAAERFGSMIDDEETQKFENMLVTKVRSTNVYKRIVLHLDHCLARDSRDVHAPRTKLPVYVHKAVKFHQKNLTLVSSSCEEIGKLGAREQFSLLHRYNTQRKRKRAESSDEYKQKRNAFVWKTTAQIRSYCRYCEKQFSSEATLGCHLITQEHVDQRTKALAEGLTPGGLLAPSDESYQSILTEISKLYMSVNQMVSQNVAGVISFFASDEMKESMFQKAANITEDFSKTLQEAAWNAVVATRNTIRQNTRATFLDSAKDVPGTVRLQQERLMKNETLPVFSKGKGQRPSSEGPPAVSREAPAVNMGEPGNELTLDEQFFAVGRDHFKDPVHSRSWTAWMSANLLQGKIVRNKENLVETNKDTLRAQVGFFNLGYCHRTLTHLPDGSTMKQTPDTNMLLRVLVDNPCHGMFFNEAKSWICHKEAFEAAGLTSVWSEQTDGEFCCLVRGNEETGTSIHILEESPPAAKVKFCIFEIFFGSKRPITEKDKADRIKSVMPKGQKEGYRDDCKRRPEIYRAGLEKMRVCVFLVEHGAMKDGPETVMKGLAYMHDAVIRHQCDITCGDGNQATSTIVSNQDEVDLQNSMLATVARASFCAFNENKHMWDRVGFKFLDNNPYSVTKAPTASANVDLDCCWMSVQSWGHSAYGHHSRCYARGVHTLKAQADRQNLPFDYDAHKDAKDKNSFYDIGALVEEEPHADPSVGPEEYTVQRNERALYLDQIALCLNKYKNADEPGDQSFHLPLIITLKETGVGNDTWRSEKKIQERHEQYLKLRAKSAGQVRAQSAPSRPRPERERTPRRHAPQDRPDSSGSRERTYSGTSRESGRGPQTRVPLDQPSRRRPGQLPRVTLTPAAPATREEPTIIYEFRPHTPRTPAAPPTAAHYEAQAASSSTSQRAPVASREASKGKGKTGGRQGRDTRRASRDLPRSTLSGGDYRSGREDIQEVEAPSLADRRHERESNTRWPPWEDVNSRRAEERRTEEATAEAPVVREEPELPIGLAPSSAQESRERFDTRASSAQSWYTAASSSNQPQRDDQPPWWNQYSASSGSNSGWWDPVSQSQWNSGWTQHVPYDQWRDNAARASR